MPVPPAGRHPRARGPAAQPHCPHRAPCAFSLCLLSPQSAYCRPRVKIHSRAAHTFLMTPGCPLQSFSLPWEEAVVRPIVECGDACVLPPQSSPVGICLLVLRQRKGWHATDGPCQTEVLLRRHVGSDAAAATLISGAGAPALPPEWVLGMPHSSSGPHSNLPREALLGKQRAVTVPLPHPPSLRRPVDAPPAAQGAEAQPAQANPVGAGPGPTPNCCLGARGRTASHVPSLLDADVEGQSRDCTLPLCRMKSRCSRPSIYELEKEFLS